MSNYNQIILVNLSVDKFKMLLKIFKLVIIHYSKEVLSKILNNINKNNNMYNVKHT